LTSKSRSPRSSRRCAPSGYAAPARRGDSRPAARRLAHRQWGRNMNPLVGVFFFEHTTTEASWDLLPLLTMPAHGRSVWRGPAGSGMERVGPTTLKRPDPGRGAPTKRAPASGGNCLGAIRRLHFAPSYHAAGPAGLVLGRADASWMPSGNRCNGLRCASAPRCWRLRHPWRIRARLKRSRPATARPPRFLDLEMLDGGGLRAGRAAHDPHRKSRAFTRRRFFFLRPRFSCRAPPTCKDSWNSAAGVPLDTIALRHIAPSRRRGRVFTDPVRPQGCAASPALHTRTIDA